MTPLEGPWVLQQSAPGRWRVPSEIDADDWVAAPVPGTVAAALLAAGRWQPDDDLGFDAFDFWYRGSVAGQGSTILRFEGLATLVEVYLDDALILRSDNMFLAHEVAATLAGPHALHLCFRSVDAALAGRRGRARWRPKLVRPPALRFIRTLLLGHIPGWGPPIHAVGPWRPLGHIDPRQQRVLEHRIEARLIDGDGLLTLAVRLATPPTGWVVASVGGIDFALVEGADGWLRGSITLPDVEPWWPHTHGRPALQSLGVESDGESFPLGSVGFRSVEVDRGADGRDFGLRINGVPVFCRGACWSGVDVVALPREAAAFRPLLELAVKAGMNMVRVAGPFGYEAPGFYALCDELGLLVWQDFAFANFDYPADDPDFRSSVAEEARQFLERTQASPCLVLLCGASEVAQQAAMMGLPPASWTNAIFEEVLAQAAAALRLDVPFIAHSPHGGALPFVADAGVSHYYGVSAHRRPLEEARRANVRFAAESLGFANVPDVAPFVLEDGPTIRQPDYLERVEHESAALWAFEGVRNHYCEQLYGVDVAALRRDEPDARDLLPGAGWGVIDALGHPKAAYYGLLRAFRPVTVVLTDENLNGLQLSLINDTADDRPVTLSLQCFSDGPRPVIAASRAMVLRPRTPTALAASELWGGFFDTTYAFRFGEPAHEVTVAHLQDIDGGWLAEAFHFPLGRKHDRRDLGLRAELREEDGRVMLALTTQRFAQSVQIVAPGYRATENWFHLAPGLGRIIALERLDLDGGLPTGWVAAVNGRERITFG